VIVNGRPAAWIGRGDRQLIVSLPDDEPERSRIGRAMAREMKEIAHRAPEGRRGWLIEEINGKPAIEDPAGQYLIEAGFLPSAMGLQLRVPRRSALGADADADVE
jgi:ATP-dependent Lhr-like helicase